MKNKVKHKELPLGRVKHYIEIQSTGSKNSWRWALCDAKSRLGQFISRDFRSIEECMAHIAELEKQGLLPTKLPILIVRDLYALDDSVFYHADR